MTGATKSRATINQRQQGGGMLTLAMLKHSALAMLKHSASSSDGVCYAN